MAKSSTARKGRETPEAPSSDTSLGAKAPAENRPVHTVRYRGCEAAIWKNTRESAVFYSVTLRKSWRDKEGWHDGQTFLASDLPMLAKAVTDAHSWIAWQERLEKKAAKGAAT